MLVNGDTTFEADEAFTVHLSNASGATISDADGTGTIVNDDAAPTFAIDDVTHNEGNSGTTSYVFTVTKTGSTALSASVDYQTVDGTATVADNDYQANNGTLNFAANETTKQITVLVNGDTKFEADEAFTVHLSGSDEWATISDADGTGTIVNDDAQPSFMIDDVSHNEGNSGTTSYVFTVTKVGTTAFSTSVDFQTQDGTATIADNDYQSNTGTLNFSATDATKQITVLVNGDTTNETNEAFTVHLSNASGATISDADGTGTIVNDDAAPIFSIDDVTHNEGNSGTTSYVFTVTKSGSTALSSSVDFQTVDGTATVTDNDYQANNGTLNFAANETTKQITVLVNGDTTNETDEAFTVHLSNPSGATISDADGTGTIVNDDAAPSFSIDNVTQNEGNSGTTEFVFTVTKTGSTALSSSVDYGTVDGTATAPSDYSAIPGDAFVSDTMTGSDGTDLTAHTGGIGATWAKVTGTTGVIKLTSNRCKGDSGEFPFIMPAGIQPRRNTMWKLTYIRSATPIMPGSVEEYRRVRKQVISSGTRRGVSGTWCKWSRAPQLISEVIVRRSQLGRAIT